VTTTSWTANTDLEFNTKYYWQIVPFNTTDRGTASATWSFTTKEDPTNINDATIALLTTELLVNFPNPFNPETTIRFALANGSSVEIIIYNVRGQLVRTLVNGYMNSGVHNIVWNGRDDNGNPVGSGVYFYHMRAGDYQSVRRMMLMK